MVVILCEKCKKEVLSNAKSLLGDSKERVALDLMKIIMRNEPKLAYDSESINSLYMRCVETVNYKPSSDDDLPF